MPDKDEKVKDEQAKPLPDPRPDTQSGDTQPVEPTDPGGYPEPPKGPKPPQG